MELDHYGFGICLEEGHCWRFK